jgi:hypothetical protein
VIVDAIGVAIAELLPASARGVYSDERAFTAARDVLRDSR